MYRAVPVSPVESIYTLGLLGTVAISPTRLRKMSTLGEVAPLQFKRTVFIPPTLVCWALSWSCPGVAVGVAVGVGLGVAVGVGVGVPPPAGSWSKKVSCWDLLLMMGPRPSAH